MKKRRPLRVFVVTLALATASIAAVATAGTSAATVFSTRNSALGEILVSASGRTLYHTSSEKRNRIECTGVCAVKWPPLLISAHAKPIAGPGVTASRLGTVKRPDGRLQVTYAGLPLYLFSGDTKAREANGQGAGGIWHAVTPSGTPVMKGVSASAPATGSTSTTSMGSGSGTGVNAGMWCAANPNSCVNGVPIPGG
jgi:predicted lipoprotein with Yx(FWY)xxD motif